MPNFNRRTVLGSLITGGIATVVLLRNETKRANASVSMRQLNVSGADVTTDSGTIKNVKASIQGNWRYAINHGNPKERTVTLSVGKDDTWTPVESLSDSTSVYRGRGSYTISGSITETKLYSTSNFEVESRGDTKEVDLPLKVRFEVVGHTGQVLASAERQDTATVSVSRKSFDASLYGEVSGDGSITIETESD